MSAVGLGNAEALSKIESEPESSSSFGCGSYWREDGEAKGRVEGRAEGEAKGRESLRTAVDTICELLGVELDEERKNTLWRLDVDGLTSLAGQVAERASVTARRVKHLLPRGLPRRLPLDLRACD